MSPVFTTTVLTPETPVAVPLGPELRLSNELFCRLHTGDYNKDFVGFECVKMCGIGDILRVLDARLNRYVYVISHWDEETRTWWARWAD